MIRDGRESLTFEEGLLAEDERIAQGWEFIWHYKRAGFYTAQIERFLKRFSREQVGLPRFHGLFAFKPRHLLSV